MATSILGVYYSVPQKYLLKINTADESSGRWEGRFQEFGKDVEMISTGGFNFRDGYTDVHFSSKGSVWWELHSENYGNNSVSCEQLTGDRSISGFPGSDVGVVFYKDLSGQGGGWFGNVDWWGVGHL
ncbi:hypothetical protein JWR97_04075 [Pseudomonas cedrina subsp. fulgida]|nr:hypothetical protein [Pseudomonas cedrina subsp. fulgida]